VSAHDVASFLKQWLRDLPEPIIPPAIINAHYNPQNPSCIASMLTAVPAQNRKILAQIIAVVGRVAQFEALNQMTPANITTCFASSFTQSAKGLSIPFDFFVFVQGAHQSLNQDGTDFVFTA
jgi:hypothetical protein